MRKRLGPGLLVVALGVLLSGCGGGGEPEGEKKPEDGPPEPNVMAWPEGTKTTGGEAVKLEGATDVSLVDLLIRPRAELAAQGDDCLASIRYFADLHQQGRLPFLLLPDVHLPLAVPVLHQAKFSAKHGFSIPPYLNGDARDPELALHLARHGDVEAALRLVNPADADAVKRIEALRLDRNYPVEWTRLAGLLLHRAQYNLLPGNVDEAKQLIGLHQQLDKLLKGKARSSPLGVELLSRGRSLLQQAANAWRLNKQEHLAEQAEAFVRAWGEVPGLALPWQPPVARVRAELLFGTTSTSKVINAPAPLRVLDLLGLALPDDGLENVVGTFDARDRLEEILLLYRTREDEVYAHPEALTYVVMESMNPPPAAPANAAPAEGVAWRTYEVGSAALDVAIVRHNPAVGVMVRVRAARTEASPQPPVALLSRDLGGVHLDRSFEQNRRQVALHKRANRITVEARTALNQVQGPITALPLSSLTLERAPGHDVLERVTLHYGVRDKGHIPLALLAGPVWAASGTAHIQGGSGPVPLLLAWEDAQTCYVLRVPNRKDEDVTLEMYSRGGPPERSDPRRSDWVGHPDLNFAARADVARAHDRAERQARFASQKPWTRLPRDLEKIKLGMTRDEVQRVLPPDFKAFKRPIPQGILVTMTSDPPRNAAAVAREFCSRFDAFGRVAEVRVRYQNGPAPGGVATLLASLEKRCGAPEKLPAPWALAWADLPPRKPAPSLRRWQDDTTLLTCQQDAAGIEAILRACTLAREDGVPMPPLEYLPRGLDNCALGTAKAALLRQWKVGTPVLVDGAVVLAPKASSPYDALLVWFHEDRVVHVVARHKPRGSMNAGDAARAVRETWTQEARALGLPWRQDFAEDGWPFQAWTTQDDRTRVRIFWQQRNDGSLRLFTEWRDLGRP